MSERFNEIQSVSTISGISINRKPKFRFTIGGIILTIVLVTITVVVPTSIILIRTSHDTTIPTPITKAALPVVTLKSTTTTQNEIVQTSTIISKLRKKSIDSISISADEESSKTTNDTDRCNRFYIDLYSFPPHSKIHSMITANLDRSFHFPLLIVAFTNPGKIEIFSTEKQVRLVEKIEFESFQPTAMLVADIDRDNKTDLFVFNGNRNELILFFNLNFNTKKNHHEFVKEKVYPIDGEVQSMFVADFNNDQRSDLIVLLKNSKKIFILFNVAFDDSFHQAKIFDIGCQGYEVTVADMNDDGFVDAVVTCPFDRQIIVIQNRGDETFVIESTIKISSQPLSIVVADINQDEKLDMITINRQINSIDIFIQKNPSKWTKSQSFQTNFELCQIRLGHVDADEKLDLIVSSCEKNFLALFQNIDGEHFQNPIFSYFATYPIGFDQIDSSIYIVQQTSVGILETVCQ